MRLFLSTALTTKTRVGAFRFIHASYAGSTCIWNQTIRLGIRSRSTLSALRGGSDSGSLPPRIILPPSFTQERQDDINAAIKAVLASCRVTRWLQPNTGSKIETVEKLDNSPVTIGDFASQAIALKLLHNQFPLDMFIAEEGSDVLRADEELLNKVWDAVMVASLGIESICLWKDKCELLQSIDYGQGIDESSSSDVAETRRVWCLDPIDGTKGFLRGRIEGGQYCIALALIEDGSPVVSVLGCPNQPVLTNKPHQSSEENGPYGAWSQDEIHEAERQPNNLFPSSNRGCLFVAVRGGGCYEVAIHDLQKVLFGSINENDTYTTIWKRLQVTPGKSKTPSQATFCLGVERGFSDPKGTVLKIAQLLHGEGAIVSNNDEPDIKNAFRLDGQGKYGILARGEAEYFLRLPKPGYIDWVWDVAAGYLVLNEAGGMMTDVNGSEIVFSGIGIDRNAKLPSNVKGLLGSCGGVFHDELVDAYASVERASS